MGCIDFIGVTTAVAAVAGIGPMKQLHPIRPDPQICAPSKLGVMAVSYLYGWMTQTAVLLILISSTWYQGSNQTADYVSTLLPPNELQACRLYPLAVRSAYAMGSSSNMSWKSEDCHLCMLRLLCMHCQVKRALMCRAMPCCAVFCYVPCCAVFCLMLPFAAREAVCSHLGATGLHK